MDRADGDDEAEAERLRLFLETPDTIHRPGALGSVANHLPPSLVERIRVVGTRTLAPLSRRKVAHLLENDVLLLHLGSGFERKKGWINVDLVPVKSDLFWDLRKGIPFPDGSVDAIFHEHVLEHIPKRYGLHLSQECFRVLKPGGVLRVVVPNAGNALRGYASDEGNTTIPFPTNLMGIESLFYGDGHVSMFDAQTLILFLRAAGFNEVLEQTFRESFLPVDAPDSESRRGGSLYVDARKGTCNAMLH
jgi:SAM-dependent methyltransferase